MEVGGEVRRVRLLERASAGERQRAHRRPVIRLRLRDHAPAIRVAPLHVIQARELQRRLVRLGAAGDQSDPGHPRRDDLQQTIGQSLLRLAREVVVVEVREPFGLLRGGRDDLRHAGPETRHHRAARARVEDPAPIGRRQPDALAALDARGDEIEETREDVGFVGPDPCSHARARPRQPVRRSAPSIGRRATSRRYRSRSCSALRRLSSARRFVSSRRSSGSTPSPSSSCR